MYIFFYLECNTLQLLNIAVIFIIASYSKYNSFAPSDSKIYYYKIVMVMVMVMAITRIYVIYIYIHINFSFILIYIIFEILYSNV